AVEARLACDVEALVGEKRHDLSRRSIAVLGEVRRLDNQPLLGLRAAVGRGRIRAVATILAAAFAPPAGDRARRDADLLACGVDSRSRADGLLDELADHSSLLGSVLSSSSPQIAWTFFWSTRSAAASASARSLR